MDRVVSSFLAELDGATTSNEDVYILAATNRPDLLDASLLRPGRLDRLAYVSPPTGRSAVLGILCALTRKFRLADDVDLGSIADNCPEGVTGADLYGLCSKAWMEAVRRHVKGGRCLALHSVGSYHLMPYIII